MKPILFGHLVSPPVRGVLLLIRHLNLDVEFRQVDLFKRENFDPEYVKMNPMHTVPVLKHDDLVATDSHSIMMYLVDKFNPDSSLFPRNLSQRTEIINKLMFNAAYFFPRDADVFRSVIQENLRDVSKHQSRIDQAYDCLNDFLTKSTFVAGENLTIGDLAILPTLSTLEYFFPIREEKWPNIVRWYAELRKLPFYEEVNQKGLDELKGFLGKIMKV